jgi:hypothetical protein
VTTGQIVVLVLSTSVLSSLLTVALMAVVLRATLPRFISSRVEEAGEVVGARVRAAVEEAADAVLPRFVEQVRVGFGTAADEAIPRFRTELEEATEAALPKFRDQVREGFKEALSDAAAGGLIEKAGGEIARKGGSVLEAGLNLLLGLQDEDDER